MGIAIWMWMDDGAELTLADWDEATSVPREGEVVLLAGGVVGEDELEFKVTDVRWTDGRQLAREGAALRPVTELLKLRRLAEWLAAVERAAWAAFLWKLKSDRPLANEKLLRSYEQEIAYGVLRASGACE